MSSEALFIRLIKTQDCVVKGKIQIIISVFYTLENIMGKRENAGHQHFSFLCSPKKIWGENIVAVRTSVCLSVCPKPFLHNP